MSEPKPWYMINGGRYMGTEPPYFDPADHPWTKTLEDNWETIRDEMVALLAGQTEARLTPYFASDMYFPPKAWQTMGLYFWKYRIHRNCRACPKTTAIIDSIPHLTAASLSVLDAGSNINPHQGDTNAVIRIHLPLVVPEPLPRCGFEVKGEARSWEEGKVLLFQDAYTHFAWNQSDRQRLIMILDVMRPEFESQSDKICASVMGAIALLYLYRRIRWLNRLPGRLRRPLHWIFRSLFRVVIPVQRRLGR